MQYKGMITKCLTMADEAIEIIIEDTDTFPTFSQRVLESLKLCDLRTNTQMFRLFEDTNLTDNLTTEEFIKAETAALYLYPAFTIPQELDLGENVQLAFTKNMPSGEQVRVFLHDVHTYDEVLDAVQHIWELIDYRLKITNSREIACQEYLNTLDPELKFKITMVLDILYGRADVEEVISRLSQEQEGNLPNGVYIQRDTE